ncbi:MAG TPA: hypothetical protein IAA62_03365 [Candidatus Caccopulliclostridium gallistercoris]|uniref:Uncharacterized protein n=1 Tax=Candidatus Caccopulliclostridium gallistercoris TaxID=2840719 RepID=A0A9D1NEC8_9FIRM|nr:hypothetical protein [Candidatus Caccopulliclostridium gallistercoris]
MNYDYYNPFTSPRRNSCCKPSFTPPCAPWHNMPANTGCDFCDNPLYESSRPCNPWEQPPSCKFPPPKPTCANSNLMWLLSGIMIGKLLDDC